jgi:hypothetical protein
MSTAYTVHDWISGTGGMKLDPEVVVVVVVALVVVVVGVGVVAGVVADPELDVVVGAGDTIEGAVVVALVALVVVVGDEVPADAVLDAGWALSFGMPLANGSRGTLTSREWTDGRAVLRCTGAVAPASGGAGGTGVTVALAVFRNISGTAMTAMSRTTMTGHSRRSIRSRRSELMIGLRSWRRLRRRAQPAGRSLR